MKNYNFSAKAKSKGFTLLEILIVVALVSIAILGLFFLVDRYNTQARVSSEVTSLTQMAAETRTKFRAAGTYNGITANALIQNGIIDRTRVTGATIVSNWSTVVAVLPIALNGVAGDGVTFNYQVPSQSCSDFVSASQGSFARITAGAAVVKDTTAPGALNTLDIIGLGAACDALAGGNVPILFALGR